MENQLILQLLLIISFLFVAAVSAMVFKRLRFPYTIGLLVVGGIAGVLGADKAVMSIFRAEELVPDIIFYVLLPALIFEAAIKINVKLFKENIISILLLAVFGVVVSAVVTAAGLYFASPLPLSIALLFGVLISATDPVAVIALFKEIGVPARLETLLDGESLLNDATVIVLFTLTVSLIQADTPWGDIRVAPFVIDFLIVLIGGILVGTVFGWLVSYVVRFESRDSAILISLSLVMAYVSYIVADHYLGVSGIMAVLSSGIVASHRVRGIIAEKEAEFIGNFWEYIAFVANSFVFLILGLSEGSLIIELLTFEASITGYLVVAVLSVLVGRAAAVFGLLPVYNSTTDNELHKISRGFQTVMFWGGLRGAVPVALVLTLPRSFSYRTELVDLTLGLVLFSLLMEGTTVKLLLNKLKIVK